MVIVIGGEGTVVCTVAEEGAEDTEGNGEENVVGVVVLEESLVQ